jgi:hypothetical protein
MSPSQGVQERALAESLKARPGLPGDAAAEALARRLAQLIDQERGEDGEAATVVKLAAEYRAALTALGLTPHARAQMIKPGTGSLVPEQAKSKLQQRRDDLAARRERKAGP